MRFLEIFLAYMKFSGICLSVFYIVLKFMSHRKKTSAVSCDDIMHGGEYDIEI